MNEHKDNKCLPDFFNEDMAAAYDERNSKLAPVADIMHFHIRLVLKDLPPRARILCVGVGTGAEILSLSREHPQWTFVGVDPSAPMLEVCRKRLKDAGVMDRSELVHGYVQDVPNEETFDAVLSIFVAHFVARADRPDFYRNIAQRLKTGGYFVSTEISLDMDAPEFPLMLENWRHVQELLGSTPESLQSLPTMLRETLCVLSPAETESLLRSNGFPVPVRFYQAFAIHGWYGKKS